MKIHRKKHNTAQPLLHIRVLIWVCAFMASIALGGAISQAFANPDQSAQTDEPIQYTADSPAWCNDPDIAGWDFYCDPIPKPKKKPQPETKAEKQPVPSVPTPPQVAPSPYPYSAQIEQQKKELEEAKARAILKPTQENLSKYMYYQRKVIEQASEFAKMWQQVLIAYPDLDYTLQRPQASLAKNTWYDTRNKEKDDVVKQVSQRFGIIWFYMSRCPYCHAYAPIIKSFSERFDIHTIAVSMDGGPIKHFPDARLNTGQAEQFGLKNKPVPATVLYDAKTKTARVIGYGVMTQQELTDNIFRIMEPEKHNDW